MIELNTIKELIRCPLKQKAETLCYSTFKELPTIHYDDDLDETYLICKHSGVSILYDSEGNSESVFFHFLGDEDTEKCTLNVLGLNANTLKDSVIKILKKLDANIIKEIPPDFNVVSALVFKVSTLIVNVEFNDDQKLTLLSIMPESSYPC